MRTRSVFAFFLLLSTAIGAQASDWVEEEQRTTFQTTPRSLEMPPVAPPRSQKAAQGSFLQGSAAAFGAAPSRALIPRYSPATANLGADAESFLLNAKTVESIPPPRFRVWLEKNHPEFNLSAQANPHQVVEVKGAWDNSAQILNGLGIKHEHIKARDLKEISLDGTKVLIINCEGKLPRECWDKVRQFVIKGGYLISTDWTLHSFLEKAFPNTIAWNGNSTEGNVVDALVVGHAPELLHGTNNIRRTTWKLDEESQMVRILRPDVVRVLARSYKLAQRDSNRQVTPDANQWGVLACEFPYGRGRVLHLVGHYDYNAPMFRHFTLPDAIPGAGIGLRQAIATNFLVQGLQSGSVQR